MIPFTKRQKKLIKDMMISFLEEYKTSNGQQDRVFLSQHIRTLNKFLNKDHYTEGDRKDLNFIRDMYIEQRDWEEYLAGNTNISSKGIGSIIKNGDNQ